MTQMNGQVVIDDRASQAARSISDSRRSDGRPTLALLSGPLDAYLNYEKRSMWLGFDRVARQRDANALYIAGSDFERAPEAVLYDLLDAQHVDGVVFFVSFTGPHATAERIQAFLRRYDPVPVLNAGWIVPGLPTLSLDESRGMRAVLDHVIQVHGCRHIAYVGRYPTRIGFEDRYRAFARILTEYGLLDPALVAGGAVDALERQGLLRGALNSLSLPHIILDAFDARGLLPGRDYEAIIASGDLDAIQTITELQARGIRVPDDVIVTGFRDGQEAPISEPPLTTVRMPWIQAGMRAAELVLDAIGGTPLPAQTYVPMELIVRGSCGCQHPLVTEAATSGMPRLAAVGSTIPSAHREMMLDQMARDLDTELDGLARTWAGRLLDRFLEELFPPGQQCASPPLCPGFLGELSHVLRETAAAGGEVNTWHRAISAMRRALSPYLSSAQAFQAEGLWQQSRIVIGQAEVRVQARGFTQVVHHHQVLDEVESALLATVDLDRLLEILAENLPRLGIPRCYLAIYEDPDDPTGWARLLMAYDEQGPVDLPPEGLRFSSRAFIAHEILRHDDRHSMLVNALCLGDEQIGLLVCQADLRADTRADTVCETLRRQISSALKGVQLRQEAVEARARAEQSDRLKSRFLSAVSHELRTPLNLLVSLSEMTVHQLANVQLTNGRKGVVAELDRSIQQIRNSALHLDHLILDVLDLARSQIGQIRLNRAPLDLRQLLLDTAAIGESLAQQKALAWHLDLPDQLPAVKGDRVRLRQVILNLLNNAVKFTAHGDISLRAFAEEGQVVVTVRDTGLGVPPGDQEAIFDEFRQSEHTAARGHGGIGLGLAISKRLVELHDGTIGVYSSGDEGSGSTFYFALPILNGAHPAQPGHPEATRSVLLLSGDRVSGAYLRSSLARDDIQTAELAFDQAGRWLEQVITARPSAIIMDAALASQAGWTVVKALKEHPATERTPVLFYALSEDKDSGSLLEMDYVAKDAAVSQLAQALERHGLLGDSGSEGPAILVVDDEPGLLDAYTSIVRSRLPHCHVLWARDGAEALRIIQHQRPDLILLDLMMPTMDGFEFMEAIRRGETTRHIPVIVLTGQVLTEEDLARLNQGVAVILRKGLFSAEETVAQVEAALVRRKCLGSETQWLVRRAMAYVHAHYAEPLSSADIAAYVSVSQAHLIRCFNRELGVTPVTYLNRWRIRQARMLLETSTRSVTQVALESGFSSQAYFSRVFRQETGTSPTAYRRAAASPQ